MGFILVTSMPGVVDLAGYAMVSFLLVKKCKT
jgi:hypothetical protein